MLSYIALHIHNHTEITSTYFYTDDFPIKNYTGTLDQVEFLMTTLGLRFEDYDPNLDRFEIIELPEYHDSYLSDDDIFNLSNI